MFLISIILLFHERSQRILRLQVVSVSLKYPVLHLLALHVEAAAHSPVWQFASQPTQVNDAVKKKFVLHLLSLHFPLNLLVASHSCFSHWGWHSEKF